jgi:hypothetical protein
MQKGNTLWQKDRLLNIAIENLPHSVEKESAGGRGSRKGDRWEGC